MSILKPYETRRNATRSTLNHHKPYTIQPSQEKQLTSAIECTKLSHQLPEVPQSLQMGFPCTDICQAGKKAGFEGKNANGSKLFYEAIRLVGLARVCRGKHQRFAIGILLQLSTPPNSFSDQEPPTDVSTYAN